MKKVPYSYSTFPNVYWKARIKCDRDQSSISKIIHDFLEDFVKGEPEVSLDDKGKLIPASSHPPVTTENPEQPPTTALNDLPINEAITEDLPPIAELPESSENEEFAIVTLPAQPGKEAVASGQESQGTVTSQPEQVTPKKTTGSNAGQTPQKKNSKPAAKAVVAIKNTAHKSSKVTRQKKAAPPKAAVKTKSSKKVTSSKVRKKSK